MQRKLVRVTTPVVTQDILVQKQPTCFDQNIFDFSLLILSIVYLFQGIMAVGKMNLPPENGLSQVSVVV
jgi:hypothetical protein